MRDTVVRNGNHDLHETKTKPHKQTKTLYCDSQNRLTVPDCNVQRKVSKLKLF